MNLDFLFDSVVVIESLHVGDFRSGEALFDRVIGPATAHRSDLRGAYHRPRTKAELLALLDGIAEQALLGRWPVLHFETHGSEDGIEVTSGEFVTWAELRDPFTRINRAMRLNLVITLAACSGAAMGRVLRKIDEAPFLFVSGPKGRTNGEDLLADYTAFYSEFLVSLDIRTAFDKLNGSNIPTQWNYAITTAEYFFKLVFAAYLRDECSVEALILREDSILEQLRARQPVGSVEPPDIREQIAASLWDQEPYFDKYKRAFFMIDAFPENQKRFEVTWSAVRQA